MRNLKFIATAAVTFIIISCADLDLSPLSEGSSNNWYHDDTEYLMSLNDLMRAEFYPIDSYPWDDDVFSRNSQEETKNGNMTSESGTAKSRWLILYKAIARSLRILNNLQTAETTTDITPANIRQYKGEAYFHLGFSYAMLATYYGDVILDKKGMSLAEAYTASRSPKREVLDYAYECLDSAAELLSDSYTGQLRPTTGAALGFKVRFALFHEDYQKAIDAAEKLMDAGTYSLEPNYQELFQKPYSNELIFYFQGNKDLRYYCADLYGSVNNYCLRQIGGNCNRGPSIQLVCSYLCTDGLPIDESLLYDPKNFWANRDPRLTYTVQPFMLKNDPRYSDYIWTRQHEKTYLELIAKGQTNYTDSLLENKYPEYFIYGYEYVPGPYDTKCLNTDTHNMDRNNDSKGSNEHAAYQGFIMKKYVTNDWTDYRSVASHAYNTFPYLRYAEILMSYVEAKNELGQCTQEILDNTINKIRERAYNGTGLVYPYVEMASQEKLRTIIRMERRMEFPFEGIRYRDLLRWRIAEKVFNTSEYQLSRAWSGRTDWDGKDMSIVSDAFKVLLKNWDEGNYPIGGIPQIDEDGLPDVEYMVEKGYQTRFYQYRFDKDKNYLWPIPASDLLVNDNLTQNPGY